MRGALFTGSQLRQRFLRLAERAAPEGALLIFFAVPLLVRSDDVLDRAAQLFEHLRRELGAHTSAREGFDLLLGPGGIALLQGLKAEAGSIVVDKVE